MRHLISSTKAEDESRWGSIAFVNKAAAISAQEDWNELCSTAWAEAPPEEILLAALDEALRDVRQEHEGAIPGSWLDELLTTFRDSFKPSDLQPSALLTI